MHWPREPKMADAALYVFFSTLAGLFYASCYQMGLPHKADPQRYNIIAPILMHTWTDILWALLFKA
jgi:hypothetical protein